MAVLFSSVIYSQGILNNGAHIVLNGATYVTTMNATGNYLSQNGGIIDNTAPGATMYIAGDWTNNSANNGFSNDGASVALYGGTQYIGGTTPTVFYTVYCINVGNKVLNVNTSIGGQNLYNGQLVLGVNVHPVDLNGYRLDITNPLPTAITASTGYIISETNATLNPSILRWRIGTNTGSYSIPFGVAGSQLPFGFTVTAGMPAATDYVDVATRATAVSANTPWASGVTHMYDPTLLQDGSDEAVIDRWWELTFTSAATADLSFAYRGSENTLQVPYNTGNLGAQWWATGWFPNNSNIGSTPAVTVGVGTATASGITFGAGVYKPMVLSSVNAPLPVELTSFKAYCENASEHLTWSTASETNNDFFTIERSDDGTSFRDIGTVNGNGTTMQPHQYSFTDPQPVLSSTYYRLRQTDYNGQSSTMPLVAAENCGTATNFIDAFSYEAGITVLLNVSTGTAYKAELFDAHGKLIVSQDFKAEAGANRFILNDKLPATGIYFLNMVSNEGKVFSKKLYVGVK